MAKFNALAFGLTCLAAVSSVAAQVADEVTCTKFEDTVDRLTITQAATEEGLTAFVTMAEGDPAINITFSDGETAVTVFAPSDAAFDEATVDNASIAMVLNTHIVNSAMLAAELEAGGTLTTRAGEVLTVRKTAADTDTATGEMVMLVDSTGNIANIIQADIGACNSVIHIVDAVLPGCMTIVEAAIAKGGLSTFVSAIEDDDSVYFPAASNKTTTYTVFAPRDEAFTNAGVNTTNQTELDVVLGAHIVEMASPMSDWVIGVPTVLETADGQEISVTRTADSITVMDGSGMMLAMLVDDGEIQACGSYIYIIDTVLPTAAVLPTAECTASIFSEATAANFTELVDALTGSEYEEAAKDPSSNFTVFAPTNAAFEDAAVVALLEAEDGEIDIDMILGTHIVAGAMEVADLTDGMTLETITGQQLTVTVTGDVTMVTGPNGTEATIDALNREVMACDSLIHAIDQVLLPDPTVMEVSPAFAAKMGLGALVAFVAALCT